MFDRSLVTSGFDTETLVSEEYLTYLLLAQVEAGLLPLRLDVTDPLSGQVVHVQIHPPLEYDRRYDPHPDAPPLPEAQAASLAVELLPDGGGAFMSIHAQVTVEVEGSGHLIGPLPAGMLVDLDLTFTESDGLESDHQLQTSLVALDALTRDLLTQGGIDPDDVESEVRKQINRPMPLGVAQGQKVQRVQLRKFVTNTQRTLGVYVDLALKSGPEPESYAEARGNLDAAQDFRLPDTPLAFATSPGLFTLLGQDAKFRQAEQVDAGGFRYPIRKDVLDPESDEIGRIKGISVGPEYVGIPPMATGRIVIDVHGEYTDALGDPDFHLQLQFRPKRDVDGLVTWDLDVDVDLGLLATVVLIAAGIGLTLLFAPGLAWGSTLIVGTIVGLAVLEGLIEHKLAARLLEDADTEREASMLDALPFRPPAAFRRWDPFYVTHHQIAALLDDDVVVDAAGIAFQAARLALDKQPSPISNVVIRDEERTGGSLNSLRYRVADFNAHRLDFDALGPGTDRMDFSRGDPVGEPVLLSLTTAQITDRIAAGKLFAPIGYSAERIYVVGGQIDALLVLSRRERDEQRQSVIDDFRQEVFAAIASAIGDQLLIVVEADLTESLERSPTQAEIVDEFSARINALTDLAVPGFEDQFVPALLPLAVARALRFDLAPEELVQLQLAGVLVLDGKEIIVRHNRDGTTTPYYRDHPDGNPRDNLLALPHYTPPYQPPPP